MVTSSASFFSSGFAQIHLRLLNRLTSRNSEYSSISGSCSVPAARRVSTGCTVLWFPVRTESRALMKPRRPPEARMPKHSRMTRAAGMAYIRKRNGSCSRVCLFASRRISCLWEGRASMPERHWSKVSRII